MSRRAANSRLRDNFADIVRAQALEALDLARESIHDTDVVDAVRGMVERIREEAQSLAQDHVEIAASRALRAMGTPTALASLEELVEVCQGPVGYSHILRPVAVMVPPEALQSTRVQSQNVASAVRLVPDIESLERVAKAEKLGAVWMPSGQLHGLEGGRGHELAGVPLYVYDEDDNLPSRLLAARLGAVGFLPAPLVLRDAIRLVREDASRVSSPPWRVILVDRTDTAGDGLATALGSDDVQVHALRGGFRLLEALDEVVPDVLVVATQLDGVSTPDLLAVLRAHARYSNIPIVMLATANETVRISPQPMAILRRSDPHALLRRQLLDVADRCARMRALRDTDPSTGVFTELALLRAADFAVASARRNPVPVTAVRVEVPDLMAVRRTDGHGAAERLLRIVAWAIRDRLRTVDAVGRMGPTGFAAILNRCSARRAQSRMQEIRDAMEEDLRAFSNGTPPRVVFGHTDTASGREDLLLRAEQIVLRAVSSGVPTLVG